MPKPSMTAEAFCLAVAAILKARRLALTWTPSDVQHHGGPTYHTVQKTERGKLAPPAILERHCEALGLTLVEVYRTALRPHGPDESPLSLEARTVANTYDRASASGQAALREMAKALDQASRARRRLALTLVGHRRAR